MSDTSSPAIKLKKVNKSFEAAQKPVQILKNINLTVKKGDFLIIFGPSGCGKSTLLHVILGLEPPAAGSSVQVLGKLMYSKYKGREVAFDEDAAAEFRKQYIGMVYQQTYWIKSQNVVQNVAFPLLLLGETEAKAQTKAQEVLESVGMVNWADYIPTELSAGQQQRVNLARALITNPQLLIADEPTGNLDFQAGQELMEMLVKLNQAGKTIVMVTHDLEYLPFASKAAEMFDGSIQGVYEGQEKQAVLKNLRSKKTQLAQQA